ncbi:MAG TPA: hypothetical protein VFI31_29620, partial [Pirellulales bacterium]|nr:hypothetical protein [Pirellulales bacterium]
SNDMIPWNVGQAFGLELTAALRRQHIDAIRAAADPRFQDLEAADRAFTARQTKSLKATDRKMLVGVEWLPGKKPLIKLAAYPAASAKPVWSSSVDVPQEAIELDKNIPPRNRDVVEFARKSLGRSVREGDCTHLAEDALQAAHVGKRGIYRWGRELGVREPWLPGDILQMERVEVRLPSTTRIFNHHTAVIDEVNPDFIVVLHQNALPDGKVVQRETWPVAGISGQIAAYRPWDWPQENPYPPASPLRVEPVADLSAGKGKKPKAVDLLKIIDPRLDRVQGIWFFEKDGALRSPNEFEARLEVPVAPPKSYTLRMTVARLQGDQQFGIGIVVGGRQTMISIDNSRGKATGFHNLDGKPAAENESTKLGTFLPKLKRVALECRVRENAVELDIDKAEVIRWQGDPARLSVSPDWPVPQTGWLFLSAYDSEFDINSFVLEPAKASGK